MSTTIPLPVYRLERIECSKGVSVVFKSIYGVIESEVPLQLYRNHFTITCFNHIDSLTIHHRFLEFVIRSMLPA